VHTLHASYVLTTFLDVFFDPSEENAKNGPSVKYYYACLGESRTNAAECSEYRCPTAPSINSRQVSIMISHYSDSENTGGGGGGCMYIIIIILICVYYKSRTDVG